MPAADATGPGMPISSSSFSSSAAGAAVLTRVVAAGASGPGTVAKAAPANRRPEAEGEVWCVLYRISLRELVRLNASEGVPGRRYRPVWLTAQDSRANPLYAVAYLADGNEEDGNPSLRYITLLREGAHAHGLPDHWIEFLAAVDPA